MRTTHSRPCRPSPTRKSQRRAARAGVQPLSPKNKKHKIKPPQTTFIYLMRFFCFTFSLYLLVLSCIPCSDSEHAHSQNVSKNLVQINFSSDEHGCPQHRHCDDSCSPLCGCNCCTSIFIFQKITVFTFQKPQPSDEKQVFPEAIFLVKDMAFAIDHPPQLS